MIEAERPGNRYWSLVKNFWLPLNQSWDDGPEVFLAQFQAVSPEIGHLYAGHWCQSEVRNGGLHQFFSNSTGILAPEARVAYKTMGLEEWAEVLKEAMSFFGNKYPRDREARRIRLAAIPGEKREEWDPFSKLDDRFYAWLKLDSARWHKVADAYANPTGGWG